MCVHHRQHLTFTFTHANTLTLTLTPTAHLMHGLLSLHLALIFIWTYRQTHEKKSTVIVEIRTQMHSHLGSYSEWAWHKSVYFPFASVITQLKCIEIISRMARFFVVSKLEFQRKVHSIRTLSQCKSYYSSFFVFCKAHITTYHVQCAMCLFRLYVRPSLRESKDAPNRYTLTYTCLNKCIVNLFAHN